MTFEQNFEAHNDYAKKYVRYKRKEINPDDAIGWAYLNSYEKKIPYRFDDFNKQIRNYILSSVGSGHSNFDTIGWKKTEKKYQDCNEYKTCTDCKNLLDSASFSVIRIREWTYERAICKSCILRIRRKNIISISDSYARENLKKSKKVTDNDLQRSPELINKFKEDLQNKRLNKEVEITDDYVIRLLLKQYTSEQIFCNPGLIKKRKSKLMSNRRAEQKLTDWYIIGLIRCGNKSITAAYLKDHPDIIEKKRQDIIQKRDLHSSGVLSKYCSS